MQSLLPHHLQMPSACDGQRETPKPVSAREGNSDIVWLRGWQCLEGLVAEEEALNAACPTSG